jgi:hypothetical protein
MNVTATRNPIEIRKVGMRALTDALGHDDAHAFLKQCYGTGDIVQMLRELPEPSHEEFMNDVSRLQEDYKAGRIDRGGRPIAGAAS